MDIILCTLLFNCRATLALMLDGCS